MKIRISIVFSLLLLIVVSWVIYQNIIVDDKESGDGSAVVYTCERHPEILLGEPGNCPICEMKLTPVRNSGSGEMKILYWVAPTDPNERYDKPGKSKMGSELVPVYEGQLAVGDTVTIDPAVQQNINLKTVEIGTRDISPVIVTNAEIRVVQRFDFNLTSKRNGWIDKLYVKFDGEEIKAGQNLCDLYSPEVVAAETEFVTALKHYETLEKKGDESLLKSAEDLINISEQNLRLLPVSQKRIEELRESREVRTIIPIKSPTNGILMKLNVNEGQKISEGDLIMQITDLGKLWVMADVHEKELGLINVGDPVITTVNADPSEQYEGMVNFVQPIIDETTRKAKVRIDIENDHKKLKPGMLVKVEIEAEDIDDAVVIPEHAVIRSGSKNIAVLALGNGKFRPVEIKLGIYSEGYYQVLKGLEEEDSVVSSAQFLIDSESSLKSAVSQLTADDVMDTVEVHDHAADSNRSGLIRTGIINVESIDENGDGKLFECPMDWNVLSDQAGSCPTCEMMLKEYTLVDIKQNLHQHGYQYE
jgi:Cu(I)/Ag(I) efflux system membrane fusion protein/cobalt-zinc-cadmium efflux system membrane fusion protein